MPNRSGSWCQANQATAVVVALLGSALGVNSVWGHGGSSHGPPPKPARPVDTLLDQDRIHDVRWSWLHWWEANRDRLLRISTQGKRQPADPAFIEKLRTDAIEGLRKAIGSDYPPLRTVGMLALGRIDADAAAAEVREAAKKDPDDDAARAATLAIGMLATPETRGFLIGHNYEDLDRRIAGCAALGLLPDIEKDVRQKMQLLLRQPPELATIGAWSLTQHAEADNLASFERSLREEESPWLASQLLLALGEHGDPKALNVLRLVLTTDTQRISSSPLERYAAWKSLNEQQIETERLMQIVREKAQQDQASYEREVKRYNEAWKKIDPNRPPLEAQEARRVTVEVVVGRERVYLERLRASAAISLGMLDIPGAEGSLLEVLQERPDDYNHVPQGFAAVALGERGSKEGASLLADLLNPRSDRDHLKTQEQLEHPVRGFAAIGLGLYARQEQTPQGPADRLGTERVLQLLAERLVDDREEVEVRTAAALALGLAGRSDALPAMRGLKDRAAQQDEVLTGYILLGRGLLGDVEVLQDVQVLLGGGDRINMSGILGQRAAVLALGVLGRDDAVPMLAEAWHSNHYISREVIIALRLAEAYGICEQLNAELRDSPRPTTQQFMAEALGEMLQTESAKSLQPFVANTNYTMKNERLLPFQRLANVFLFDYLIPAFGDNWP